MKKGILHIIIILSLFADSLSAQVLYVGGEQTLFAASEAIISVRGGVDNRGTLVHGGEMLLEGDWVNLGQYEAAGGWLRLTSPDLTELQHSGQQFHRLGLENGGRVSLLSDISILEELVLDDGLLLTDEHQLIIENNAEISGGSQASYVEGSIQRSGSSDLFFPLGLEGRYQPLRLLDIEGDPVLRVNLAAPNANPQPGPRLDRVLEARYWEVVPLSGSFGGARVTLDVGLSSVFDDLTGLVVAAAPALGGTFVNLGNADRDALNENGLLTSEETTALPIIAVGRTAEFALEGRVLVPNAFAPDGNNPVDRRLTVFAVNLAPENFVFRIFNRWGQLEYETTSLEEAREEGWDGINQQTGQQAQFGVYTFFLNGFFEDGSPVTEKGTITLFR